MIGSSVRWLEAKPFEQQILTLALVLDPLGFATGYLAAPYLDVEPLMGGVYGLVAASFPLSMWIMHNAGE